MNKIFIDAHPCIDKILFMMTCQLRFLSLFLSTQKSTAMRKNFLGSFLEFSVVLATQTNSKSGEDVFQIIEPDSLKSLP